MTHNTFRTSVGLTLVCSMIGTVWLLAAKPTFTQTYDLPAPVPCEGLDLDGVAYSFTVAGAPSLDCVAGSFGGPGIPTNNISRPNIHGAAVGILHLTFAVPTTNFGFGVARSTELNFGLQDSVVIDLFRPGAGLLREELFLDLTLDPEFVGGRFDYEGPAVKTVTIAFHAIPSPFQGTAFVIDNVTYSRPRGQSKK